MRVERLVRASMTKASLLPGETTSRRGPSALSKRAMSAGAVPAASWLSAGVKSLPPGARSAGATGSSRRA